MRLMLIWPIVIITTLVLYGLIILTLPFSSIYATIFLFALIAFWSRLPGVGIPDPLFFLYNLDLIDIFCVIISINLGGISGAIFAFTTNTWSRVCGVYPDWLGVMKDSVFQSVLCLFLPLVYSVTGSLFMTVMFFTIGRSALFLTVGMLMPHRPLIPQMITEVKFLGWLIVINGIYVSLFGSFFDDLLKKGVQFSWSLFIFATIVIVIFYFATSRNKPKEGKNTFLLIFNRLFRHKKKKRPVHHAYEDRKDLENLRRNI